MQEYVSTILVFWDQYRGMCEDTCAHISPVFGHFPANWQSHVLTVPHGHRGADFAKGNAPRLPHGNRNDYESLGVPGICKNRVCVPRERRI